MGLSDTEKRMEQLKNALRSGRMTAEELILTSREKVNRFTAETKKYHLY